MDEDNALPLNDWELHIETSGMQTRYRYSAKVSSETALDGAALILDDISSRGSVMGRPELSVMINGVECEKTGYIIDRGFAKFEIGRILEGENEIRIAITGSAWSGDTRPLTVSPVLLGAFELSQDGHRLAWKSARTGFADPSLNGYPYYSGTSRYTAEIELLGFRSHNAEF